MEIPSDLGLKCNSLQKLIFRPVFPWHCSKTCDGTLVGKTLKFKSPVSIFWARLTFLVQGICLSGSMPKNNPNRIQTFASGAIWSKSYKHPNSNSPSFGLLVEKRVKRLLPKNKTKTETWILNSENKALGLFQSASGVQLRVHQGSL